MREFVTGQSYPDPVRSFFSIPNLIEKIKRGRIKMRKLTNLPCLYFIFVFNFAIFSYLLFYFNYIKINIFHKK